ncbi:MAG: magnesium transporter, partial [Shinella sp.]
MITVFRPNGEACALPTATDSAAADALDGAVWIDLLEPTRDEEALIERVLSIEVPTRDELKDIEPSSRLYTEGNAAYLTASLMVK